MIGLQALLTNVLHRSLTKVDSTIVTLIQFNVHPRDCVDPDAVSLSRSQELPNPPFFPMPWARLKDQLHDGNSVWIWELIKGRRGRASSKGMVERDRLCFTQAQPVPWIQLTKGEIEPYTIELNNKQAYWVKNWPYLPRSLICTYPPPRAHPLTSLHEQRPPWSGSISSWQGQDARAAVTGTGDGWGWGVGTRNKATISRKY